MPTPENPNTVNGSLTEKIEELDSLINKKKYESRTDSTDAEILANDSAKIEIPVLDELVSADDYVGTEAGSTDSSPISEEKLTELVNNLERKFAKELNQLVDLFKANLKDSTVDKLKTESDDKRSEQSKVKESDRLVDQDIETSANSNYEQGPEREH